MYSYKQPAKPRAAPPPAAPRPALRSVRLLDQVRECIRYKHYSIRTEQQYVFWVKSFVRFHGVRHPSEMGVEEVRSFLVWLASERKVAASTHKQALSALLFLYREVLGVDLPWLKEIGRPKAPERLPTVLSKGEVERLLAAIDGSIGDLARLVYGCGLRLMEALKLRIEDVDFDRRLIVVREGKGNKDRVVMLPETLREPLRRQVGHADLSTTMIYTHVLNRGPLGVARPLDRLA